MNILQCEIDHSRTSLPQDNHHHRPSPPGPTACNGGASAKSARRAFHPHSALRSKQREGPFGWGPLFGNVIIVGTASSSVPLATIPRSPAISVTLAFRLRTVHAPFTTLHGVARSVWLLRSSLRAANQLHIRSARHAFHRTRASTERLTFARSLSSRFHVSFFPTLQRWPAV